MIAKAPRRSVVARVAMMLPPVMPGAPQENTAVQNIRGMKARLTTSQDCSTNSPRHVYGGVTAETIVCEVRISMLAICSSQPNGPDPRVGRGGGRPLGR
jgi:hypothetical protein